MHETVVLGRAGLSTRPGGRVAGGEPSPLNWVFRAPIGTDPGPAAPGLADNVNAAREPTRETACWIKRSDYGLLDLDYTFGVKRPGPRRPSPHCQPSEVYA